MIGEVIGWKFNHQLGMRTIDGVIVEFPGGIPSAEDQAAWTAEYEAWKAMSDLRAERDRLLADSDWTQVADAPVNAAAWATYRQALRDLPANTTDLSNPAWPVKPGA